jgi:uncharacterized membrane protein
MDGKEIAALISRWLHVPSVILLVGGSAFMLWVLAPAADKLGQAEHDQLRKNVMERWRKWVHPLVALIFLSGLYNFLVVRMNSEKPWHMLAGIKLLLGLIVLFIASSLAGRGAGTQKMRDNWRWWLKLNLILAFVAVLLSGYMKFIPAKPKADADPPRQTA